MKILFPIGSFYPAQSGGPSNTLYWHCSALSKEENYELNIITTNKDIQDDIIQFNKWYERSFGKIIYTSNKQNIPYLLIVKSVNQIRKSDILHLTSLFYPPSLIIFFINRMFFKRPIIWSIRGELNQKAMSFSRRKKAIILSLVKLFTKRQRLIFHSTSGDESKQVRFYFGNYEIAEIPNFMILPEKQDISKEKKILYLGRLHPIKGLENLICALCKSKTFLSESYKLYIAGRGNEDYINDLSKVIDNCNLNSKIVFLGQVEGDDKEKLIASSKFLVLPSFSENFGNVVIESLAQGTPVIASKGTPWRNLEEHNAGFWTSNDPELLGGVIEKALNMDKKEYLSMSYNAYRLAKSDYDVFQNIEFWTSVYRKVR